MYRTRDHIDIYRSKCVKCNKCRDVCPSYNHGGCDPLSVMMGDNSKVFGCIGCGNCSRICNKTDPKTVMLAVYSIVLDRKPSQAFIETGLSRRIEYEPSREVLVPVWTGNDVYIMPGCIVKCLVPFLEYASSVAIKSMGIKCMELPKFTCCMYPIQFGSMDDDDRYSYIKRMGKVADGKDIITLCAGCSEMMQRFGVRCEHIVQCIHKSISILPKLKGKTIKVLVEPGCAATSFSSELFDIVQAIGCDIINNKFGCCGKSSKNVSGQLMEERQKEAKYADMIVVGCPMCFFNYDKTENGKPVVFIGELVSIAYGDLSSLVYHHIRSGFDCLFTGIKDPITKM